MSKRYDNMTGGYTLQEAGRLLGSVFPEDTRRILREGGIRPTGGTTDKPRFNKQHVGELAAIRQSQAQALESPHDHE